MKIRYWRLILLCVTGHACAAAGADFGSVTTHAVKGGFDDIRDRVVMAIENRGLVLNYTAHVGAMLERTGKDIGRTRQIYTHADVLEFCSAGISRAQMEADPRNIAFCPYAIAVYVLPADPGRVHVSYRKPAVQGSAHSAQALREVGKLLDGIAREALK
jgi:uncharacterized protein (DUF302 family)